MKKIWLVILLSMVLALVSFPTVYAQEKKGEFTLEEIVVTAERRETSAQDTPIAVSAWDEELLDEQNIGGVIDLQMRMPSTSMNNGQIYMRGIGREMNQLGTDPGVGLFFDGFYNSEMAGLQDLWDVERMESVRGPQSTLYGRSTIGGALNIIYKQPTKEWSGQLKARIGNYERRNFYAAFGGPIYHSNFYYRIALTDTYYGGHIKNIYYDAYQGTQDRWSARISLLYEPTESFNIYAKYNKSAANENSPGSILIDPYETEMENWWFDDLPGWPKGSYYKNPFYHLPAGSNPSVEDRWKVNQNIVGVDDLDSEQWDLTATLTLSDLTIKYLGMWRKWDSYVIDDADYGPKPEASRTTDTVWGTEEWSMELQAQYGGEGVPISVIGGLYYYTENRTGFWTLKYKGSDYWESLYDWEGNGILPPYPAPTNFDRSIYWFDTEIWDVSMAAYAQIDYLLTEKLNFTLGGRYAIDDKKGNELRFYNYFLPWPVPVYNSAAGKYYYHGAPYALWSGYPLPAKYGTPTDAHKKDWGEWLWKLGVDYKMTEDSLFYAMVNRGYKPGGFVLGTIQKESFDAEFLLSYEAGWKQQWMKDRFRTSIGAYFYDYQDKQVTGRIQNETRVWNAADAEAYGIELEAEGYIIENLLANFSYSYLKSEYKDFIAIDQAEIEKGEQQLAGNPLRMSPENKFAISGTYTIPTDIGDFAIYGIYSWTDEQYFRSFATWRSYAKPWDRLDVSLMWYSPAYKWRATLWTKNVMNTAAFYNIAVGGPYENYWRPSNVLDPFTFGFELSYSW